MKDKDTVRHRARKLIPISICMKMNEPRSSKADIRQQPLTLASNPSFFFCFLGRNMLTPGEQGKVYCPVWSGDTLRSAFIHQNSFRTPHWPTVLSHAENSGWKHCYTSCQDDKWMEGVIGLWKQVTPTPTTTLFSLPFLSASGKIKTKWMAALWAQDEREIKSVSEKKRKRRICWRIPRQFLRCLGRFW